MPFTARMSRLRSAAGPSAVLFACLFASQSGLLVLSPILPDVAREFGVSNAAVGQLRTLLGAVGGATAILLAVAPRRPGIRDLLSAGALLVLLGSVLSAAAPSLAVLAVAQGVLGVGIGLLVAVGIAAAGEWPAPARRPQVLAWTIVGMPASWVAGMPIVAAVSGVSWRAAWLALPALAALLTFVLLRLRPADPPCRRTEDAVAAWRSAPVARFVAGELLANAAWASVLTYAGVLLLESYGTSTAVTAIGLGIAATAMLPGTFSGRRGAANASAGLLAALTLLQAGAVTLLTGVRPGIAVTLALLGLMAFFNGRRSMVASALGMDTAPGDKVAVMSMRAAANQFGYLLGAAAGGLALTLGGIPALGATLAAMYILSALIHLLALVPDGPAAAGEATS
jgi:predicted MFS family arabinose efflux permease